MNGNSNALRPAADPSGPVTSQTRRFGSSAKETHLILDNLESRLAPILRSDPPPKDETATRLVGDCQMAEELILANNTLDEANARLTRLMDRLQL